MKERERIREELIALLAEMGRPRELGEAIANSLGTEMTMTRMMRYLRAARPESDEEIVDEMLAIINDRDRWVEKKKNEYYNRKYNEYLWFYRDEE